ncbi:MAG: hypothetical protein E7328_01015 [Clostridiales bacterium]|nr:hypothetical protein [Clostridiales bacterium]
MDPVDPAGENVMFRSNKEKLQKQQAEEARAKIKEKFREFMQGEGRLPRGFSEPYNKTDPSGYLFRATPFEGYLSDIRRTVDSLNDRTGISDWLYFDGSLTWDAALKAIARWANRHRQMNGLLHQMTHIGKTVIMMPASIYCREKIMVVVADPAGFDCCAQAMEHCKKEGISFCTILSDRSLYDLTEQTEKEITYLTYPNYHDETYADWAFSPCRQ